MVTTLLAQVQAAKVEHAVRAGVIFKSAGTKFNQVAPR
jgi:hypothetical protein